MRGESGEVVSNRREEGVVLAHGGPGSVMNITCRGGKSRVLSTVLSPNYHCAIALS